jgi:hypothetical protein
LRILSRITKGPKTKRVLNWGHRPGIRREVLNPLAKYCFKPWGDHLPFTFNFVESNLSVADITIDFLKNGQGGIDKGKQAFAASPTDGRESVFQCQSKRIWGSPRSH